MNTSWERFIGESQEILTHFSKLELIIPENEPPQLSGALELENTAGDIYDQYQVKVVASDDSSTWFPGVFEVGGRLPHNSDWHVFEDGHCCIKPIPEQIILCRKGLPLLQFIQEHVLPYFHAQKFREQHGYYLHERSHGELGNLEYIAGVLKTQSRASMRQYLWYILHGREPSRSNRCFCGSRKLYRYCHRDAYRNLCLLPKELIYKYVKIIDTS
ncbi:hypothetical protein EDD80_1057 [Anseongella ginsenosidimutans]|uniref:SEC-C motif-containing protein n=1 Tax=Anseongella ginsenosidimutans TaxID=496056 RepID=A0A4V2UTP8_9SPHI|nr:hypothetical protein EDD80_1057 [Anseongella ginsenosidimutans]